MMSATFLRSAAEHKFYDQGWNAAHNDQAFQLNSTRDWQDGYRDYKEAPEQHQREFPKL